MVGNRPGYGASTYIHKDVQLCSCVRLIELRGSEGHPNPRMLKHACFPHWQESTAPQTASAQVTCIRRLVTCTAAGLCLLNTPRSCTSRPQRWLTSELASKVTVPNKSFPITTLWLLSLQWNLHQVYRVRWQGSFGFLYSVNPSCFFPEMAIMSVEVILLPFPSFKWLMKARRIWLNRKHQQTAVDDRKK